MLEQLGEDADFLSVHRYVNNLAGDTPEFLASGRQIDRQIEEADAVCRFVQGRTRSRKRPYLCFDEWNVWYKDFEMDGHGAVAPHLIEEVYNLEDALVVAGFLNSFIRRADVVRIANLAQIVNVIAPLLTRGDDLLVQSIFHPFQMMSARRRGSSLRVVVDGPTYSTRESGEVPFLDVSAIVDDGLLHLFIVNRSTDHPAPLEIDVAAISALTFVDAELLTGPGAKAVNDFGAPPVVSPHAFDDVTSSGAIARTELPPLSFLAASFTMA